MNLVGKQSLESEAERCLGMTHCQRSTNQRMAMQTGEKETHKQESPIKEEPSPVHVFNTERRHVLEFLGVGEQLLATRARNTGTQVGVNHACRHLVPRRRASRIGKDKPQLVVQARSACGTANAQQPAALELKSSTHDQANHPGQRKRMITPS
jgi:hypothetical protein